ncbi:sulfurtransferase complex subunit TusB [Buchnera aphidicola]|uniref:Protein TusB n=1 Tax=Buchnera aphidicola subsp. Melaphis rhois TaxID=118103 RepID=A0A4D6Y1W1_BUCMH|nr:sulfurtransferase complex subunit TusB [Buchnera aphidicola]QCI23486.1 sulfurtransferase complex subunit TusB [Buchnera aphidicola (Melaphis rhois)]
MLHILMRSPFEINMILLIDLLRSNDDVVVLQDSVILSVNDNIFLKKLLSIPIVLYAIKQDVYARGIQKIISYKVNVIDYVQFVYLTKKHKKQMSW